MATAELACDASHQSRCPPGGLASIAVRYVQLGYGMTNFSRLLLVAALVSLCACSRHDGSAAPDQGAIATARAAAAAWLQTARFEDADPVIDCRPDCREQERGFDYARVNRIERPGDCDLARVRSGANEDFIEGCRAYGQYLEAAERRR